jgi:hypothetical protein
MDWTPDKDMAVIATYATTYGPEEFCGFIMKVSLKDARYFDVLGKYFDGRSHTATIELLAP